MGGVLFTKILTDFYYILKLINAYKALKNRDSVVDTGLTTEGSEFESR
jgi:hypothetical protein